MSTKDKGQEYENQLRDLKAFVAARRKDGWKLAHQYIDQGSGKNSDRVQFKKLFKDAARRRYSKRCSTYSN